LGSTFGIIASILVSGYLGILTFLTFIIGHYQTYHESRGSFGLVNLRSLIIGTTNTLIATYLASLGYGVDSILTSLALATVLTILTFSLSMPRYSIFLTHKKPLKNLLVYGLKLQLGKVVNNLQAQYPKLVFAGSPLALTIYSLSSSLVAKAAGAVTQLAIAFFPYSISSSQSPKHKQYYTYTQLALFLLSLIVVSTYSYYGENILFWWLKDQAVVSELHSFLLTYRYYGLLLVLTPLASAVLDSRNMSGRSSLYGLAALLIELAVVGATLTSYGVMSVAYGSVAGLLIMVPVLLYTTQKNVSPAGN
jgi:hypothetical protein